MHGNMRVGLSVTILAAALLSWEPAGQARQAPSPASSPRNASYTLSAALDTAVHTITGSGRLTWRNISHIPATELRFHLYWNAWRNSASSWMREQQLGRNSRLAHRPDGDWASIDLTRLALADGSSPDGDLLARARFIAPDDGNPDDRTVLSVPLDRPIAPGETITAYLGWTARVPRTFARTGVLGDYYFIGQWFPKVGVLEDAGWNCHQFHAATEFFSDFGVYDVTLTVPDGWVVGATGREMPLPGGSTTSHRFVEEDVHDFAWTTSPDFLDLHEPFEEPGLPAVDIRLLLQPEHADQAGRHFSAARAALKDYGTWFGPYPYGHLTVVDPAPTFDPVSQGESTGGMEYPTLYTAGTRWSAPWRGSQPESVTIHENGHQFWYGIVATNEFENAWMDEGFNTFSTARVMADAFPNRFVAVERYFGGLLAWPYDDVPWSRDIDGNRLNAYRPVASYDAPSTPTWRYWPGSASAITYNKTALWLATLERYLGWPAVQKILAAHFARGAFRHPTPDEFFALASEVAGQDLTWFFDAVHRSSASFDYGVAQITDAPMNPRGLIGDSQAARFEVGGGGRLDSTVVVRRFGDGIFPVDVRVTFDDGSVVTEKWDGRDRWKAFSYRRAAPVSTVQVDPDRVLLLDLDYTNNSWTAKPRAAAAAHKWALRWLTWLEDLLLTYASFS
jgi:Peptidase family M1 domain